MQSYLNVPRLVAAPAWLKDPPTVYCGEDVDIQAALDPFLHALVERTRADKPDHEKGRLSSFTMHDPETNTVWMAAHLFGYEMDYTWVFSVPDVPDGCGDEAASYLVSAFIAINSNIQKPIQIGRVYADGRKEMIAGGAVFN